MADADAAEDLNCNICNFQTNRKANFEKHLQSQKHKNLCSLQLEHHEPPNESVIFANSYSEFIADADDDVGSTATGTAYNSASSEPLVHVTTPEPCVQAQGDWHPFSSKIEMLCYVFMSSASHPVSEEVVKFVLFMLKEAGVSDVPSLLRLKSLQFGNLNWEDMITKGTDQNDIPFWILKPTELLKLLISNPKVSSKLIRKPSTQTDVISHPADAEKWRSDINFHKDDNSNPPIVTLPVNLFLDDTSTHKSKRWLPLHCIQMQLSGLPSCDRMKQNSVFFIGASEKVEIMDLGQLVVDDMLECERGEVLSLDAQTKKECIIKTCIDVVVADYAMMSHCTNHLGATAKKYCPRCFADAENFNQICQRRTPDDTRRTLSILNMRCSEKDRQKLRSAKGLKEHVNCFWDVINPHSDIPVGLLHLIPLGLAKHLIKYIINDVDDEILTKMSTHLDAVVQGNRFVDFFKYMDSRQGKDFKDYLQIAPFNMKFAGVPQKYVKMVSCLSLIQLELHNESFDEDDLEQLQATIDTYLSYVKTYAPELQRKAKSHLLLHIVDDIRNHGPPKCYVEDAFEKNHGNIREQIFLQNQKARSRDTCIKFTKHTICQHILSGGFFKESDDWKCASVNVLCLGERTDIKKFMGEPDARNKEERNGTICKLHRHTNRHAITELVTDEMFSLLASNGISLEDKIQRGSAMTAGGDMINAGDWVEYQLSTVEDECSGVFKEGIIVTPKRGESKMLAILQKATEYSTICEFMGCPRLHLEEEVVAIPASQVRGKINVMHDCIGANCRVRDSRVKERVEQEEVLTRKVHLHHNYEHGYFFKNYYMLRDFS
ncbi:uncharacterized protein LOC134275343 [Saccostrea cucullata]|uniref:uncharacterized protein LOC134275343 n=1 Tax=Saccostrea cuccullata TaxID=36930 RepID=UPI002ED11E94